MFGWPEHACRGCSLGADQVAHLAHLNARDTTLAYASRAPQADIARLKARMGWEMPWHTITDSFDADFGVDEWHGHNVFLLDSGAKCNRALREPDLHVFAKLFENCLKRSLEAQAFSGREIGGDDDVLDFLVGYFVDVDLTRQPAS